MNEQSLSETALHASLLLLTFITGIVDAASFVAMGHVFTANMTGNVVFLAFAFAGVKELSVGRSLTALAASLLGGVIAGRVDLALSRHRRRYWLAVALALEAVLLLIASFVTHGYASNLQLPPVPLYWVIALTALGMGIRNGTIRKLAIPELTTTVLTLTVAGLASESSLGGGTNPRWKRRVASIVMMFLGAASGVLLLRHSLFTLLIITALLSGLCAAIQIYRNDTLQEIKLLAAKQG